MLGKSDEKFQEQYEESHQAVLKVAQYLSTVHKHAVHINAPKMRPTQEERENYSDSYDMAVLLKMEVKLRSSIYWTGRHDFPFDTIIVDNAKRVEKCPEITWYWFCNRDFTNLVKLRRATIKEWTKELVWDPGYGCKILKYKAPIKLCEFIDIRNLERI